MKKTNTTFIIINKNKKIFLKWLKEYKTIKYYNKMNNNIKYGDCNICFNTTQCFSLSCCNYNNLICHKCFYRIEWRNKFIFNCPFCRKKTNSEIYENDVSHIILDKFYDEQTNIKCDETLFRKKYIMNYEEEFKKIQDKFYKELLKIDKTKNKVICDICGSKYKVGDRKRHEKTIKHKNKQLDFYNKNLTY